MNELIEKTFLSDEYTSFIEELQACFTEYQFRKRWDEVEAMWMSGRLIRTFSDSNDVRVGITELVDRIADDLKVGKSTLWLAVQIYDYAKSGIEHLPDGKNISVRKLRDRIQGKITDDHICKEWRTVELCKECGRTKKQ